MCVRAHSLGEVGELPPPSVEEVEGGLASTGRGTGRAIGGGGGGGSMGVGRKGLWTFPWELPLGWGGGGSSTGQSQPATTQLCVCVYQHISSALIKNSAAARILFLSSKSINSACCLHLLRQDTPLTWTDATSVSRLTSAC